MTYSINKTDGTIIAVVADGTIDTTTSLQLPGKLFQNYGEPINENLIKLLENSASGTEPSAPLAGELWWDTTNTLLKVYNGSAWSNIVTDGASSASIGTLDTNTISSSDSSQVTITDGLTVTGAVIMMENLPTSDPTNSGQLWNDSGTMKVSAG